MSDDVIPSLPAFFKDVEQAAMEIGAAMTSHPFQLILDMLESYEVRLLVTGLDDPACSKDYLRGFVHGVRGLRADLVAARAHYSTKLKAEEIAKTRGEQTPFRHPGSGPGGLS